MSSQKKHKGESLGRLLRDEHHHLEARFERLFITFRGGDPEAVRTCWQALDAELNEHLRDEETLMLPGFSRFAPEAGEKIRAEHARIRLELERLGVDLDLKNLSPHEAEAFMKMLREHAAYEERVLYPWVVEHASDDVRQTALRRLLAALQRARADAPPASTERDVC